MRKAVNIIIVPIRFFVRAIYYIVGMFFHYMERAANWVISYNDRTEYIKQGACRKCGICCKVLAIEYPRFFDKIPGLTCATIKWHEFRYGFTYLNSDENYFLYTCNFTRPDGRCGIYRFRPRLCREYPKMGIYGRPPSHMTCGFYFTRRDGRKTFDEELKKSFLKTCK